MENQHHIIIMAGGLGKRMNSEIPKVLHKLHGKPMILHVIETAFQTNPSKLWIIVGKFRQEIVSTIEKFLTQDQLEKICYIDQPIPLGTGHAIKQILPYMNDVDKLTPIMILSGDVPLIRHETLEKLLCDVGMGRILTTNLENPTGNGRIITDDSGHVIGIIEEKDCNSESKLIKKINCGSYVFRLSILENFIPLISNNNHSNEYYLTDIIGLIAKINGQMIDNIDVPIDEQESLHNVNTLSDLNYLENI